MSATLRPAPFFAPQRVPHQQGLGRPEPHSVLRTPYLDLDLAVALTRFRELSAALPGTPLHYAVKANSHPALLAALAAAACRFDVAGPAEVRAALAAGAAADQLVYSNPVKHRRDVASAAALGVRLFVVDSVDETRKVADAAPGSAVLCRIATSGAGSDWSLSRFGCSPQEGVRVLRTAARCGLDAAGIAFHVGSQQRDPEAWDGPLGDAAAILAALGVEDAAAWTVDHGGGFPAHLEGDIPPLSSYGSAIEVSLRRHFGANRPRTIAEPGRGVVADAGTLVAEVIGVADRGGTRCVTLDAGVFTGLVETLDEAIRYRIRTSADGGPTGPCALVGPTCDNADVLYREHPVQLPLSLREGDTVRLLSAGAYTSCYSTAFNGFEPLPTRLV
jgi:ornithine decarboxylase